MQLMESLKQLQMERDPHAENLKGEGATWQQRVQRMGKGRAGEAPPLVSFLFLSISEVPLRG